MRTMDDQEDRKPPASAPTSGSENESGQNTNGGDISGGDDVVERNYVAKSGVIEKERALMLDSSASHQPRLMSLQETKKDKQQHEEKLNKAAAAVAASNAKKKRSASEALDDSEDYSGHEDDSGHEGGGNKDELSAKREYNRVSAAKSRAKRKKTLSGLNDMVEEETRKYNQLYEQNKTMREKVGALFQDTLSGLLGTVDTKEGPDASCTDGGG